MKRVLLIAVSFLFISGTAAADHIGIYADPVGASCDLGLGFTTNIHIIHKFSAGATASRFQVSLPAGSVYFAFSTPFVPVGIITSDLALGYGMCFSGDIVPGTIIAILAPGAAHVLPAQGFANIIFADCAFAEKVATGGSNCGPNPAERSTWGGVKALYR